MAKVIEPGTDVRHKPDADERPPSIAISSDDWDESGSRRNPFYKRPWILAIAAIVLLIGIIFGVRTYLHAISHESTDDAFIDGHIIPISPKAAGHVVKLHITDNQLVKAGDLLVEIDPRDYEARLAQARANLEAAQARHDASEINVKLTNVTSGAGLEQASAGVRQARSSVDTIKAQVATARSRVAQARAQIKAAQANA